MNTIDLIQNALNNIDEIDNSIIMLKEIYFSKTISDIDFYSKFMIGSVLNSTRFKSFVKDHRNNPVIYYY
jgi:hypothetical protein